jgi:hypothetical protein
LGCKRLDTDFFNILEVIPSKKRCALKKKRVSDLDYVYQYKDHLGNVRLSYGDDNNDGDIDVTGNSSLFPKKNNYFKVTFSILLISSLQDRFLIDAL